MIRSKMIKIAATTAAATAVVCTGALAVNVTSTTDLNVRSGPGNSYSVVTVLKKGSPATKVAQYGNWAQVTVNGKTGYAYMKYLVGYSGSTSSSSSSSSVTSTSKTVTVTASALNVRSGPSTSYGVIGGLNNGNTASVVGTSGDWYKIKYGSGYGYISSKYTTDGASSSTSSSSSSTTSAQTMYCTTSGLNVRSGPGTSYSSKGSLSYGQAVTVVDSSSYWYKIKYGSDYGYVGSKYISATKPSSSATSGSTSGSTSGTSSSTSSGTSSANGSSMVSYAKTFLGCDYVYGAEGPSTFDCSGFTQYIYKHYGKSIPRSSSSQYASCTKISKSSLQPGDLVFFSNNSSGGAVGHVAMYIGNGQIIHAANPNSGVCITNLNSSYYIQHYVGSGRY